MNNYLVLTQAKKPVKLPSDSPVSDPDVDALIDDGIDDIPYDDDDEPFDDLDKYSGHAKPYAWLFI